MLEQVGGNEVRRDPAGDALPVTTGADRADESVGSVRLDGVESCNMNEHEEAFRWVGNRSVRPRSGSVRRAAVGIIGAGVVGRQAGSM